MSDKHICQVAITSLNASALKDWYHKAFGMAKAGMILGLPPMPANRIQGIHPNPIETISWLVDRQDYFQMEFFQFYRPASKPRPTDRRPCDIGYSMVGIVATDFDKVLHMVGANSDNPIAEPMGPKGERRVCVTDPEGNWIEIMERDPLMEIEGVEPGIVRPELPTVTRFMRVSVPNLENARNDFVNAMGLREVEGFQLHTSEHEAMWGLSGAETKSVLLRSANFLVELVEYQTHEPKPRDEDYRICDQGFMNIALGYRKTAEFDREFGHAVRHGMRPNGKPVDIGIFRVMYVNDSNGFSVEMLNARKWLWSVTGFNPREPYVAKEVTIDAPKEEVWKVVSDHSKMGAWSVFKCRKIQPGLENPNGTGCIRHITLFGSPIMEEVVRWDEGNHYVYKLRKGAPFSRHQGDVFVTEENEKTRVRWVIRFESENSFYRQSDLK